MTKTFVSGNALNAVRLIATISAITLAGNAFAAGEAIKDFYRSLVPSQHVQKLHEECYDKFGKLVITPRNVELCSALPTAAIAVSGSPPHDNNDDPQGGGGTPGGGPSGGPGEGPGDDPGDETGGKGNNGHGNNTDGADVSNPGKSIKHDNDSSAPDDDEKGHGNGPNN